MLTVKSGGLRGRSEEPIGELHLNFTAKIQADLLCLEKQGGSPSCNLPTYLFENVSNSHVIVLSKTSKQKQKNRKKVGAVGGKVIETLKR